MDENDTDPREFITQFVAAVDTLVPGLLEIVQPILDDTQGDANRAIRRLMNDPF